MYELIVKDGEKPELIGDFIEAKKELTEAVNNYNAFKSKLADLYNIP